jgi:SWI/SNF-related matrix-associated actin-dependent regulator 1 of chromatin subfamily A
MGLGKTIESLYWLSKIPSCRPALIVTPASVKYQWQSEAREHFGMLTEVLEGRDSVGLNGSEIIIVNYDILPYWLDQLLRIKPKIVIADECQYIKNIRAKRTQALHEVARYAKSKLGLSGTPLTNRPAELWSSIYFVRPDLFPNMGKFMWKYCQPRRTPWGWKFDGARNLPELHGILKSECMIRRLKKNVLPELPDKVHEVVPFKLASYTEYNKARDEFLTWLASKSLARAKRARRAQILVRVGYLLRLCAELKLPWVIEWLKEFREANPDQKIVAMTMHKKIIDALSEEFPNSVVVDGRVSGKHRLEAVRKFQSSKNIPFFFGNWKAAGIGLNLTASSTLVSLDFPWTPGDLLQGQDRIHRIGQTEKCIIYYLVALNTIEEKLLRALQKKQEIITAVLDGKQTKDFNLIDQMLKQL